MKYNLNARPEWMDSTQLELHKARHPGRLIRQVDKDDRRPLRGSAAHKSGCADASCPGCAGAWGYEIPDTADVPDVRLASAMAQIKLQLVDRIRSGRTYWTPEEHPALLEAAKQAVRDSLVAARGGGPNDDPTVDEVAIGAMLGRGYLWSVLDSVRDKRERKGR